MTTTTITGYCHSDEPVPDGLRTPGEPGIVGAQIGLYDFTGTNLILGPVASVGGGAYTLTGDVPDGAYLIRATPPFTMCSASCREFLLAVSVGSSTFTCNFAMANCRTIVVNTFNDNDGNGAYSSGDTALSGVSFSVTSNDGCQLVTGITDGTGTALVECANVPVHIVYDVVLTTPNPTVGVGNVTVQAGANRIKRARGFMRCPMVAV